MKKSIILFVLLVGLFSMTPVEAQIKAPAPSPFSKVEQKVGLTDVVVEYSRPSIKDRVIFGGLVPFDKMWRTGANKNTILTFSDDVKIEGQDVAKGSYALFTKPGQEQWEIVLYKNTENWGVPRDMSEEMVAVRAMVEPVSMDVTVETFLIDVGVLRNSTANIGLVWENTYVPISLEVPTDEKVMANIDRVMKGPSGGDYYTAARYYKESGHDLGQALAWMNKSIEMDGEKFWVVRQKALIQAAMKDYEGAIGTAARSMELAKEAGNEDYIANNKKSIAKWSKMLQ